MKTFYFDGTLPDGFKAIKQDFFELDKNKYIIIDEIGNIKSSIICDSTGYVEVIENYLNGTIFHKRVFSENGEYEEEFNSGNITKKHYSTASYDLIEKYKGIYIGEDDNPARIKKNLEGITLLEEWYEKNDEYPFYGKKHRKNSFEKGKLKSNPARIVTNLEQKKVIKYYYFSDNLNDGASGEPAIQEFDLETGVLLRSVRMKENILYKGESPSIKGKINNNYEYEIYDKDNLKSCDIKIKNDIIQKNINIEDGKICDSEIIIDLSTPEESEIVKTITKMINENPKKLIEILKELSFDLINSKYNTDYKNENNNNEDSKKDKEDKNNVKSFKKRNSKNKNVKDEAAYGVI